MKSVKIHLLPRNKLVIPFAHFEILQGAVYRLLSVYPELSDEIHNKPPGISKQFKFFCFTDIKGRYFIKDNNLIYTACVGWEIRSADDRIIDALCTSLKKNKTVVISDTVCDVISSEVSEKHFFSSEIIFKMNTPLLCYTTAENGYSTYFSPDESTFCDGIKSNIRNKFKAFFGYEPQNEIVFEPIRVSEKDKCVTKYKKSVITAYYGLYRLKADSNVINFIYYTGLGAKNSLGFGTAEEVYNG